MTASASRALPPAATAAAPALWSRDQAVTALAAAVCGRGFAIAHDLLRDRAEAEDAVQEALTRAVARFDEVRDPAALAGWFHRVLTNHCLRTLRRRRLFGWLARRRDDDGEPDDAPPEPISEAAGADELLAAAAERGRLLAAIDRLPPMQRAVVVLRFGHDVSLDDAAAMLDVAVETIKTHQKRALARLRAELERPR